MEKDFNDLVSFYDSDKRKTPSETKEENKGVIIKKKGKTFFGMKPTQREPIKLTDTYGYARKNMINKNTGISVMNNMYAPYKKHRLPKKKSFMNGGLFG